mgnify:CR=1 FL=1
MLDDETTSKGKRVSECLMCAEARQGGLDGAEVRRCAIVGV